MTAIRQSFRTLAIGLGVVTFLAGTSVALGQAQPASAEKEAPAAAAPAAEPAAAPAYDIWTTKRLTGDWGGFRTPSLALCDRSLRMGRPETLISLMFLPSRNSATILRTGRCTASSAQRIFL